MTGGTFEKDFWARVLEQNGLESPGYHEASQRAREISAAKKEAKENGQGKAKKKKK